MKQEDRDLLLRDLCAKLQYGVVVNFNDGVRSINEELWSIDIDEGTFNCGDWICNDTKPYLRPMSSMTEEERSEMGEVIKDRISPYGEIKRSGEDNLLLSCAQGANNLVDWLDRKMFDHRGLIPKNLAIEVTAENNPYK